MGAGVSLLAGVRVGLMLGCDLYANLFPPFLKNLGARYVEADRRLDLDNI